ncbi:hypothetical protein K1T73_17280 [Roseovarius sp. SCSIO 43702]|uniref:hypothetical protein n=1 Tax=Roseovarius sp. SCSIO 43702 TaxID=2823043 RepID=UPI001C7388EC|nr:hypothetical protein [Roseovarius sp. SCSIO 43702]QYX56761.1 hypothetical protein K1T73_17280 [Roseovarius sp. SCSIO 43702]
MSDPVTNVEIEDVLSSIRRLVSGEDKKPADKSADAAESRSSDSAEAGSDRLVLTPSLRVDPAKDAGGEAPPDSQSPDTRDSGQPDQAETELHHEDDAPETAPADRDEDDATNEAAPETLVMTSDALVSTAAEDALKARVAEMEIAVAAREEEWEPDGLSEGANAGGPVEPLPWEDYEPEDAPGQESLDALEDDSDESEGTSDADPAESGGTWDTDEAADGEPMADPAPMDLGEGLRSERRDRRDEAGAEDILDEETLRELVAEIVREELQGTLGEKITRNVRKLVRREIHRALAIQDLE